jgi:hypothetical protein
VIKVKHKIYEYPMEVVYTTTKIPENPNNFFKIFMRDVTSNKFVYGYESWNIREIGPRKEFSSLFQLLGLKGTYIEFEVQFEFDGGLFRILLKVLIEITDRVGKVIVKKLQRKNYKTMITENVIKFGVASLDLKENEREFEEKSQVAGKQVEHIDFIPMNLIKFFKCIIQELVKKKISTQTGLKYELEEVETQDTEATLQILPLHALVNNYIKIFLYIGTSYLDVFYELKREFKMKQADTDIAPHIDYTMLNIDRIIKPIIKDAVLKARIKLEEKE